MQRQIFVTGIFLFFLFVFFFTLGTIQLPENWKLKTASSDQFFTKDDLEWTTQKNNIHSTPARSKITQTTPKSGIHHQDTPKSTEYYSNFVANHDPSAFDSVSERVMIIGDSQLESLRLPLSNYCEKNNHKLVSSILWYGSSTKEYALTDTLKYFINRFKPTVVFFAIGLNELFVRDFEDRTKYIEKILSVFAEKKVQYCWIGPAAWTKDRGIVQLMQKKVGNSFYPSHQLQLERANDRRHPSSNGGKKWFDQIATFSDSLKIIRFSHPVEKLSGKSSGRMIVLNINDI